MSERGGGGPKPGTEGVEPGSIGKEQSKADTRATGNKLEQYFRQNAARYPVDQLPRAIQERFKNMPMGSAEIRSKHVDASTENENMQFDVYFVGGDKDRKPCFCVVNIDVYKLRKLGYRIDQTTMQFPTALNDLKNRGIELLIEQIGLKRPNTPDGLLLPKGMHPAQLEGELIKQQEEANKKKDARE